MGQHKGKERRDEKDDDDGGGLPDDRVRGGGVVVRGGGGRTLHSWGRNTHAIDAWISRGLSPLTGMAFRTFTNFLQLPSAFLYLSESAYIWYNSDRFRKAEMECS